MYNRHIKPLSYVLLSLLCTASQCAEPEPYYKFIEQVALYPAQKNYRLGDTIWLEYRNPAQQLFDSKTQQSIAVSASSMSLPVSIDFDKLENITGNPSDNVCDFVTAKGVTSGKYTRSSGTTFNQQFGCATMGTSYDFKIGVVPKEKGVYCLAFNDGRELSICPNSNEVLYRSSIGFRFNVTDTNADVYLAIPNRGVSYEGKGGMQERLTSKRAFILRVQ